MPSDGGEQKIGGEDKRNPLEFHAQLEDERVHTVEELKTVLQPAEESDFERDRFSGFTLERYLTQEENKHWGNPQYENSGQVDFHMSLKYAPWLKLEEDTLIQGRVIADQDISDYDNLAVDAIENSEYLETLDEDHELCWISIPTDPETPLTYMEDISTAVDLINMQDRQSN